jgi:putative ABC transport system permease protein
LQDARDGNRQIGGALGKAERYLNMASLVAVLLAGVAVACRPTALPLAASMPAPAALPGLVAARNHGAVQPAIERTGPARELDRRRARLAGATGPVLLAARPAARDVPPGGLLPAIAGIGTGLVALAGFALPPLAALGRVPPLRVLRRDMLPIPSSTWMVYGAALFALGLIMWRLSLDLVLTFALLGAAWSRRWCSVACCCCCCKACDDAGPCLPALAPGLGQLLRHPLAAAGQSLAFGLILLSMGLIALLRGELLDTWQNQLPKDAPTISP